MKFWAKFFQNRDIGIKMTVYMPFNRENTFKLILENKKLEIDNFRNSALLSHILEFGNTVQWYPFICHALLPLCLTVFIKYPPLPQYFHSCELV